MLSQYPSVRESFLAGMTPKRGKVRDIYDFGDEILLVSTDRISAFDWVLPNCVPDKGKVLTQTAAFWFETLDVPNHLITTNVEEMPLPAGTDLSLFAGRSTFCKKAQVVPVEAIVRGYLSGSGWNEYRKNGAICGIPLPPGMQESDKFPEPIFTPTTKAETGHDENITFEQMVDTIGEELAGKIRDLSIKIYEMGRHYAIDRGIIIADTKFEFGIRDGELLLVDEVLTPDSSRFWPQALYTPGKGQPSFDKQFVRDWLLATNWDRNSPPPQLPNEVILQTREKYIEAFELLTGRKLLI